MAESQQTRNEERRRFKWVAWIWVALIVATCLFPPIKGELWKRDSGVLLGLGFAFDLDPQKEIHWGILALEWLFVTGLVIRFSSYYLIYGSHNAKGKEQEENQ